MYNVIQCITIFLTLPIYSYHSDSIPWRANRRTRGLLTLLQQKSQVEGGQMFLVHSNINFQVTEQLRVQPEGLITEEVLQAASHEPWKRCIWTTGTETTELHDAISIHQYL